MLGGCGMAHVLMSEHYSETETLRSSSSRSASRSSHCPQATADTNGVTAVLEESIKQPIGVDFLVHTSKVLGRGHSGEVVVAIGRRSGVAYAVKTYTHVRENSTKAKCCQRECMILRQLHHPNVTRLQQVYEDDAGAHMVLDLHSGGELYQRLIANRRFTENQARVSTLQMLLAVEYLHKLKIVHRDVKMENWVYEDEAEDASLRLCDFGFARFWDQVTRMSTACGTLPYMAPEVLMGAYTDKCDLWSLGVILFALLTGSMPFRKVKDIKIGKYVDDCEGWVFLLSDLAKDFIAQLLVVKYEDRLSASDAREHAWITVPCPENDAGSASTEDVTRHVAQCARAARPSPDAAMSARICEDADRTKGELVQTLLTCKHLYAKKEKAPLTDEEYDGLMAIYANLQHADVKSIHEQLQEFRQGVGHLTAKQAALTSAPGESARHHFGMDYKLEKAKVKRIGDGLVKKLQRLHHDPLLKSAVSDEDYDSIVEQRQMLDTVEEEPSDGLNWPDARDACEWDSRCISSHKQDGLAQGFWKRFSSFSTRSRVGSSTSTISGFGPGRAGISEELELPQIKSDSKSAASMQSSKPQSSVSSTSCVQSCQNEKKYRELPVDIVLDPGPF